MSEQTQAYQEFRLPENMISGAEQEDVSEDLLSALADPVREADPYAEAWTEQVTEVLEVRVRNLLALKEHILIPNLDRIEFEEAATAAEIYYVGRILARIIRNEAELEMQLTEAKEEVARAHQEAALTVEKWAQELAAVKAEVADEAKAAKAEAIAGLMSRGLKITAAEKASADDPNYQATLREGRQKVARANERLAEARQEMTFLKSNGSHHDKHREARRSLLDMQEQRRGLEAYLEALRVKASFIPGLQGRANAVARAGF